MHIFVVLFSLSLSWFAQASQGVVFSVYYKQEKSREQKEQFEQHLRNGFSFVLQQVDLQAKEFPCQVNISFNAPKGIDGKVLPKRWEGRECFYDVDLEASLEYNWMASIAIVHEFTHMIRHEFNPAEVAWLDEGLATLLQVKFSHVWPLELEMQLQQSTHLSLSKNIADYFKSTQPYAHAFFFIKYLYDHFAAEAFLRTLIRQKSGGSEALQQTLLQLSRQKQSRIDTEYLDLSTLWLHYGLAVLLNTDQLAKYGLFKIDGQFHSDRLGNSKLLNSSSGFAEQIHRPGPKFFYFKTQGLTDERVRQIVSAFEKKADVWLIGFNKDRQFLSEAAETQQQLRQLLQTQKYSHVVISAWD